MDSSSVVDSALGVALAAGLTFSLLSALFASGAVPSSVLSLSDVSLWTSVSSAALFCSPTRLLVGWSAAVLSAASAIAGYDMPCKTVAITKTGSD